ncbi:MAG: DNA repair protein RecO [Patescibacteria group bacterium]
MSYYQTKGLTLKRRDSGEDDRLFVVYTKHFGKVEVLAKGGKKIKSKLVGHLEPFLLSEVLVARGINYDKLAGSNSLHRFNNIWQDTLKISLADCCLELVDVLTKPAQPDQEIYELLAKTLHLLDQLKNKPALINLTKIFSWQLLSHLGYQPELFNCLICRQKIVKGNNFFDPAKGGLVCQKCSSHDLLAISDNAIKVLRLFLVKDITDFARLKINDQLKEEVNKVVDFFVKEHLGQELKSHLFLLNL